MQYLTDRVKKLIIQILNVYCIEYNYCILQLLFLLLAVNKRTLVIS